MTNPDNAGGLPERWRGLADKCEAEFPQKAQIFRWCANELCRAAPAGGDDGMTDLPPDMKALTARNFASLMDSAPAVGRPYGGDPAEPRDDSDRYDSATAGSGEVEAQARALYARWIDQQDIHCNRFPAWQELSAKRRQEWLDKVVAADTGNPAVDRIIGRLMSSDPDFDDCAEAAALLRKLSQAGSGEVEPLPVFSGNWIYVDTGQRFSGADLDGAAFAVYEPLLRKLQQGADTKPKVGIPFEVLDRVPGQPADEVWLMQDGKCLGKFKVAASQGQDGSNA